MTFTNTLNLFLQEFVTKKKRLAVGTKVQNRMLKKCNVAAQ